jgi:hypothetical protein
VYFISEIEQFQESTQHFTNATNLSQTLLACLPHFDTFGRLISRHTTLPLWFHLARLINWLIILIYFFILLALTMRTDFAKPHARYHVRQCSSMLFHFDRLHWFTLLILLADAELIELFYFRKFRQEAASVIFDLLTFNIQSSLIFCTYRQGSLLEAPSSLMHTPQVTY